MSPRAFPPTALLAAKAERDLHLARSSAGSDDYGFDGMELIRDIRAVYDNYAIRQWKSSPHPSAAPIHGADAAISRR